MHVEFFDATETVDISSCTFIKNNQTTSPLGPLAIGGGSLFLFAPSPKSTSWNGKGRRKVPCPQGFDSYRDNSFTGSREGDICKDSQNTTAWACPFGCKKVLLPAACRRGSKLCREVQDMKVVVSSSTFTGGHASSRGGKYVAMSTHLPEHLLTHLSQCHTPTRACSRCYICSREAEHGCFVLLLHTHAVKTIRRRCSTFSIPDCTDDCLKRF